MVAIEANKLLTKMLTATSVDEMKKYHDQYLAYLEAHGWDDWTYDQTTLERVNEGWDEPKSSKPAHKSKPRQLLN